MISRVNRSRLKEGPNPVRNLRWSAVPQGPEDRNQDPNHRLIVLPANPVNAASKEEAMMGEEDKENQVVEIMVEGIEEEDFK